jgi:hypothetical protein
VEVEVAQETHRALQVAQVVVEAIFTQMQVMVKVGLAALLLQGRDLEVEMGLDLAHKQQQLVVAEQAHKV